MGRRVLGAHINVHHVFVSIITRLASVLQALIPISHGSFLSKIDEDGSKKKYQSHNPMNE